MGWSLVLLASLLLNLCFFQATGITLRSDVTALQDLWRAWQPAPPQAGFLRGWNFNEDADPCGFNWEGVSCTDNTITGLDLRNAGLQGHLSAAIGGLQNLEKLDLSMNPNLMGNIPKELGNLKKLTSLKLSHSGLSGDVPSELVSRIHLVSVLGKHLKTGYGGRRALLQLSPTVAPPPSVPPPIVPPTVPPPIVPPPASSPVGVVSPPPIVPPTVPPPIVPPPASNPVGVPPVNPTPPPTTPTTSPASAPLVNSPPPATTPTTAPLSGPISSPTTIPSVPPPGASPSVVPPAPMAPTGVPPEPTNATPEAKGEPAAATLTNLQRISAIVAGSLAGGLILLAAICLFCRCRGIRMQKKLPFQRLEMT